ncbi:MAG TPA: 2'-5' RNA ligase family protein [Patescibacteria group bacterium]|nr:2'-5' RNA ligase family protein [Patescibacteria group bacterium]
MKNEATGQTVQLNIAIIPDTSIQEKAIVMSEQLMRTFATQFVLNTQNLIPHITISQARYPQKNIGKVIDIVRNEIAEMKPFPIHLDQCDLVLGEFVFWNARRLTNLVDFHQQIVQKTNSLREGLVIEHVAVMQNLSPEDRKEREQYGALLIGSRYTPHITVTRLKQPTAIADIRKVLGENTQAEFAVSKIIVGYLGNHGTVTGVIEELPIR